VSGPGRDERGLTLLEVLIAVTITAIIVVVMVAPAMKKRRGEITG